MGIVNKARVLVVLVILIASSVAEKPSVVEARTLSLTSSHQGYSKFFATLGLVCKCCDGVGDNLIFVEPNDDAQSEEDLDDDDGDGDGDESDDIHGDDPIRGLDMLL
ncbi:hypothetical protein GmHk_01G001497 [Glycine max]|nr:hypothetical protein GmHk_01G001497 [Glycine max]